MIESRCGLHCAGCSFKESHGCKGCVETNGVPFYGECDIAVCCQDKGLSHCGECGVIPCKALYEYSYLDPEHGDNPPGARVRTCRDWAAESGKQRWENVLLTSGGWWKTFDINDGFNENIRARFLKMLGKAPAEARVLFIPTAAIDDEAQVAAKACMEELLAEGIPGGNIRVYDIDGSLTPDEAMRFDVIYFTGGNTRHLLKRVIETRFDEIVKRMVYTGKVYIGASAGSLIAMPNLTGAPDDPVMGLCLIDAYLSVHCAPDAKPRGDLPLSHIPLRDNQALAVSWQGYELIED